MSTSAAVLTAEGLLATVPSFMCPLPAAEVPSPTAQGDSRSSPSAHGDEPTARPRAATALSSDSAVSGVVSSSSILVAAAAGRSGGRADERPPAVSSESSKGVCEGPTCALIGSVLSVEKAPLTRSSFGSANLRIINLAYRTHANRDSETAMHRPTRPGTLSDVWPYLRTCDGAGSRAGSSAGVERIHSGVAASCVAHTHEREG
mmetsp:Transcript_63750/g.126028  ORF Transcript_63750/g.126028 Transcript_63750/m.126028 type:complete len:204 (-) Transcript_63750:484-1095(-)